MAHSVIIIAIAELLDNLAIVLELHIDDWEQICKQVLQLILERKFFKLTINER